MYSQRYFLFQSLCRKLCSVARYHPDLADDNSVFKIQIWNCALVIFLLNEEQRSSPSFFFPPFFWDLKARSIYIRVITGKGECSFFAKLSGYFLPLPCRNLQLAGGNQEGPGMAASVSHGTAELPSDPQGGDRAGGCWAPAVQGCGCHWSRPGDTNHPLLPAPATPSSPQQTSCGALFGFKPLIPESQCLYGLVWTKESWGVMPFIGNQIGIWAVFSWKRGGLRSFLGSWFVLGVFFKAWLTEKQRFKTISYSQKGEVFKSSEQSEFCVRNLPKFSNFPMFVVFYSGHLNKPQQTHRGWNALKSDLMFLKRALKSSWLLLWNKKVWGPFSCITADRDWVWVGVFTVSIQASCKNIPRQNPLLFGRKLLPQSKPCSEILLPLTFGNTLKITSVAASCE